MFPPQEMPEPGRSPNKPIGNGMGEDPALQKQPLGPLNIIKGVDFEGIASNMYAPSDSNMAVGPNEIVEVVNVLFQVFNKTGGSIAGPTNIQNVFSGLAGDCSSSTYGDPVVLYDRAADRWLISMIGSAPVPRNASPFRRRTIRLAPIISMVTRSGRTLTIIRNSARGPRRATARTWRATTFSSTFQTTAARTSAVWTAPRCWLAMPRRPSSAR